jgi:hypothetical protein
MLLELLGIMNSKPFRSLVELQMAFGSYEVGVIERTPVPSLDDDINEIDLNKVANLSRQYYDSKRNINEDGELSHSFKAPFILQIRGDSLSDSICLWRKNYESVLSSLQETQSAVDLLAFHLYAMPEGDSFSSKALLRSKDVLDHQDDALDQEENDSALRVTATDEWVFVTDVLAYSLGTVLGRWDVRIAIDAQLSPRLQRPFDPLPVCSPGMLVGPDGLPATRGRIVSEEWLRARPDVISLPAEGSVAQPTIPDTAYPLRIDWDGILVDDEGHADDIVGRTRDVLTLLWSERAEDIEEEACQILGLRDLRNYYRDPKRFWDFHVKRYSKSRRKAPIYWLLQSSKRSYGLWLYYHRLDSDTLFKALRYVNDRLALEEGRLAEVLGERANQAGDDPRARREIEKRIEASEAFILEVTAFRDELRRVADLGLVVDHDDGVLLSIAPLHNLVPWAPAKTAWNELVAGKYEWSSISQQMRARGLVKGSGRG